MDIKTIIPTIIFVILYICELKVFFYQRTLRKLAIKHELPNAYFSHLYPTRYRVLYLVSRLKWVVLILLFIFNWIIAVICLMASYILMGLLPEQNDYKNIQVAKSVLGQLYSRGNIDIKELNQIRLSITSALNEFENKNSFRT